MYKQLVLLATLVLLFGLTLNPAEAQEDCVSYSEIHIWVDEYEQFDFQLSSELEVNIIAVSLGIGRSDDAGFRLALYQWNGTASTKIAEGLYVSGMNFLQDLVLEPARYSIMLWWDNPDEEGVIQVSLIFPEVIPGYRSVFLQGNTRFGLEHYVYVQPGPVVAEITRGENVTCEVYDYNTGGVVGSFASGEQYEFAIAASSLHGYEHNQTYVLCSSPSDEPYRVRMYFEPDVAACGNASPTLGEVLGEE